MDGEIIDDKNLYDIADAIRNKNGESTLYRPQDMADAINNIGEGLPLDSIVESIINGSITTLSNSDIITISNNALRNLENLESINLPNCVSIDYLAFTDCLNLEYITLSSCTDLSATSIFENCTSLTNITLPLVTIIGSSVFQNCTSLTEIDLPNVITIGTSAFEDCSSLTTINLPSCQTIGGLVFYDCALLTSITLGWTGGVVSIEPFTTFLNTPLNNGNGHIYVPANLVDTYKADSNWSKFANLITSIT